MTDRDIIDAAGRVLARHPGVALALLFGSVARGTATPDSDMDLAVDLEVNIDPLAIAAELTRATGREVHLLSLRNVGVPLLEELVRDAVVVHEGSPHAAARWRSSALAALELDRPWYARMRDAWLRHVADGGLGDGQS